jgi:hypothetical protein
MGFVESRVDPTCEHLRRSAAAMEQTRQRIASSEALMLASARRFLPVVCGGALANDPPRGGETCMSAFAH